MAESELTRPDTEMEKLKTKKADRLLRKNKLQAFMGRLRGSEQLAAFDEGMFLGLTETVRVYPDRLVFVFRDGTEIPVMKERNKPAYSALRRMLLHWGSILFFCVVEPSAECALHRCAAIVKISTNNGRLG